MQSREKKRFLKNSGEAGVTLLEGISIGILERYPHSGQVSLLYQGPVLAREKS